MAVTQYGGLIEGVSTTVTAASTTTLTNVSQQLQVFTGTSTQTVVMPVATTFTKPGYKFEFYNNSTGTVTILYQDMTALATVAPSTTLIVKVIDNTTANGTSVTLTNSMVTPATTPAGALVAFGGASAPSGWLMCDGSAVSRSTYAALFAAIASNYGSGDGSTTFNLPDMRGRFPRGVDAGSGNDPDASSRTASNSGGNTGDNVGSLQADAFQTHIHTLCAGSGSGGAIPNAVTGSLSSPFGETSNNPGSGNFTSETRPKNVYVTYIIKT